MVKSSKFTRFEVPSVFRCRNEGASKMGRSEMIGGIKAMLRLRWLVITKGAGYFLRR